MMDQVKIDILRRVANRAESAVSIEPDVLHMLLNAVEEGNNAQATINGIMHAWEGRAMRDQLVWFSGKLLEGHDDLMSEVISARKVLHAAADLASHYMYLLRFVDREAYDEALAKLETYNVALKA